MPHREIFYSLSRADFHQIAESDSAEQYKMLNQHFESAVDAVENSRDTVLSVFELYATKSAADDEYLRPAADIFDSADGSARSDSGNSGYEF